MSSKTLIVVESPTKIKKISSILGSDYLIRASYGHVIDLATGGKHGLGVDIEDNFKPKYLPLPDRKDKIAAILDAAKQSDQILLATDPDREGEAIAWHIADKLKSINKPIKRISIHEITKDGVKKAIANQADLDENLFDAQQARRVLDRIVGFMVSPFLIQSMGPNLSAGRVQSVAVRIIVDRDLEIAAFKPEEFWDITAQLAKPKTTEDSFSAKYIKKVTNEATAKKVKGDLDSDTYKVKSVEAQEKKRNPLPPLTTPKLQQAAAARFGFPVSKTMKLAQSLYESGLITYMRTDSTRLAPEFVQSVISFLEEETLDIPDKPNQYPNKGSAQDAHEAIRPSDVFMLPQNVFVNEDQQKLYRLIWERAVASQMLPAIYDTISIIIKSSSGHELKTNGRTLKYSGWLHVATDQMNVKSSDDENDVKLPVLKVGDELVLVPPKVKAEKKETKPPPRYSEGSLVKELERRNIGRPSTYADIVEKIKIRNYVELKGKIYHSTELGRKVIDNLVKHFKFMNYDYTADMELQLDKIAEGKLKYVAMLDTFFNPFQKELKVAYSDNEKDYGFNCPKCNKHLQLRHGKFGYYLSCPGYPECKTTMSCELEDGKPVIKGNDKANVDGVECPECKSGMVKRDGKFGPFYSCSKYPKCNGKRKVPSGLKCNKCNLDMYWTVFDNIPKLACTGYPGCKNIMEAPAGAKIPDWINPEELKNKKPKKSIQKVLNASR